MRVSSAANNKPDTAIKWKFSRKTEYYASPGVGPFGEAASTNKEAKISKAVGRKCESGADPNGLIN